MHGEAVKSLRARPRTLLAGVGMVLVAVAAMVVIPSLTNAASAKVLADLNTLGSNAWIVAPQSITGVPEHVPGGGLARASDLPGVSAVLYEVSTTLSVQLSEQDQSPHPVGLIGLDATPAAEAVDTTQGVYRPVPGYPFALIGAGAATILAIGTYPVTVIVNHTPIFVTGVLHGDPLLPELDTAVVTDTRTALALDPTNATDQLVLREAGGLSPERIRAAVDPVGDTSLSVTQPAALVAARAQSTDTLGGLAVTASAVAFGIAALGIAIMLTSAVRQRTAELAVRRVHGASTRAITALISTEGAIIGLAGGLVGLGVSNVATTTVIATQGWPSSAHWQLQLLALGAAIGTCLVASLPPALVAIRIEPARAFAVE